MRKALAAGVAAALAGGAAGLVVSVAMSAAPAGAEPLTCAGTSCSFTSPTGAITCVIDGDSAACSRSEEDRMYSVKLLPNGALDPCINLLPGVGKPCQSYATTGAPALAYGQTAGLGPYTCLAEASAISCTVAPQGKGFSINSTGILPVAGTPPPPPPPPPPPAASSAVPGPVPESVSASVPESVQPTPPANLPSEELVQGEPVETG